MAANGSNPDAGESRAFNFGRAGLVAHEQQRTLRTLDEQFGRNLTHTLGAWLRTSVTLTPQTAEQTVFSSFMERTAEFHSVRLRLEPVQARGVMALDLKLAPVIIDLLLGGSGRVVSSGRELTEIETAVLESVLDIVLREWNAAWSPFGLDSQPEMRERESHGQRLMPLQEKVFCARFHVTLADVSGELTFCMPSSSVLSALRSSAQKRDRQRQRTPQERERMLRRVGSAALKASLHFPSMRLQAEDLRQLRPGSLLPLPLLRGSVAELRIGGTAVFRAQPVRAGDHRAAQIMSAVESNGGGGE